jgi:hypothetical protein
MRGPDRPRRLVAAGVLAAALITLCWSVATAGAQPSTSAQRRASTTVPHRRTGTRRLAATTTTVAIAPLITAAPTTTIAPTTTVAPLPSIADQGDRVTTKGKVDDPAQKRLRLVIGGLVGLAIIVAGLTIWLWRATKPSRAVADAEDEPTSAGDDGPSWSDLPRPEPLPAGATQAVLTGPLEGVRVPRRPVPVPPGHREPIWADEHVAAAPMTITTAPTPTPVSTPDVTEGETAEREGNDG